MKASFALLEFLSENVIKKGGNAEKEISENIAALKAATGGQPSLVQSIKTSETVPRELFAENFVVICGSPSSEDLQKSCKILRESQTWPLVAVDAVYSPENLKDTFADLENNLFQLARTPAIVGSIRSGRYHIYPYAKPDCTATVCLLFDEGTQVLVIERKHYPYEGREALPGGFIRVMVESLEDAAYRELEEECSIRLKPGDLVPVDLRSAPNRDPRAHIIDAGYAMFVDASRKSELLAQLKAGDDASKAHLRSVKELLEPDALAFDHRDLLVASLKHYRLMS